MKEIYEWVPWFKELSQKIAEGGERYLVERAKTVAWKDDSTESALLKYGDSNIDPLSFFYTLASQSKGRESRNMIYPSIVSAFGLSRTLDLDLDDGFIFPTPPGINTLFHKGGDGDPQLIWRIFRGAVSGLDTVKGDDFEEAFKISNVATRKLTQVLFLVNPNEFLPIDDQTKSLGIFDSVPGSVSWEEYRRRIGRVKEIFRDCQLFEANLFSYLQSSSKLHIRPNRCFQVSTNVYNDNNDRWDEFDANNFVFAGGPGEHRKYPLGDPEPGDVVLVRFGLTGGRGIGVVYRNDYQDDYDDKHRLHVLWLNKAPARLSDKTPVMGFSVAKGTVDVFRRAEEYDRTFELLDRLGSGDESEADPAVETVSERKHYPFNQILYGPPGTGKTWKTTGLSLEIVGEADSEATADREKIHDLRFNPHSGEGRIAMVTFHQNFTYEDFVEGIRPVLNSDEELAYEMRAGVFKRLVEKALERRTERFVLIIAEINRGNIAKIFGELITLMEGSRRIGQADETHVTLPYSGETFGIPDNLYVIGTMNTADRSIQLLDTALRRRFTFVEMMPDPDHEGICRNIEGVDCSKLLRTMNDRIAALLDREHQIGHTYLLGVDRIDALSEAVRNRIFPLLQEYFFDDWAKIWAVLDRNAFIRSRKIENLVVDWDSPVEAPVIYERVPDGDPAWEDPGQYRRIYAGAAAGGTEEA